MRLYTRLIQMKLAYQNNNLSYIKKGKITPSAKGYVILPKKCQSENGAHSRDFFTLSHRCLPHLR